MSTEVPGDTPRGREPGPDPDRLLVVGGIGGAGAGLATYRKSAAARFAHHLAAHTGRGAEWHTIGAARTPLSAIAETVDSHTALHRFDVVVLLPGVADALAMSDPALWRLQLSATIETLKERCALDARIIVAEVPDAFRFVQVAPDVQRMLDRQRQLLNQATHDVCAHRRRVRVLSLPPIQPSDFVDGRFDYASLYDRMGGALADSVVSG